MTSGDLFGIRFAPDDMGDLLARLQARPPSAEALPLFTLNVAHVASLRRDRAFREAYRAAWLATADGMPIFLYARRKGLDLHKIAGSDIVVELFSTHRHGMRAFFVASSEATAQGIRARLLELGFEDGALSFVVPPFGFEADEAYSRALAARIEAHGTTHLLMGVGAPKSEIWVVRWKAELGGCFALCVGAGLDYLAGTRTRAPVALQAMGLEWAWRLVSEPRRLARRYLVDGFVFLYVVAFGKLDLAADERATQPAGEPAEARVTSFSRERRPPRAS